MNKTDNLNNSISIEQINDILNKYAIGKESLCLLLGWGSKNINRYLRENYTPEGKYKETLQRIYNEPEYFMLILHRNKNNISPEAYVKSKMAVQKLLKENFKDSNYFDKVVEYVSNEIKVDLSGFEFSDKCVSSILDKIDSKKI